VSDATRAGAGRDNKFGLAVAAAVAAIAASAVVLAVTPHRLSTNLANVFEIVAPLVAFAAALRATRRAQGRGWRIGWLMVALSCLSWCIGQVIWTWFETIRGVPTPFPSLADLFFLLAIPLAVGGLLAMPSSANDRRDRARVVLDGMIVAASLLFISWISVLGPTLHQDAASLLERAIALAYPAGDVMVLTMVVVACTRSDSAGRVAVGLAGAGFAAFALADSFFVYTTLHTDTVSNVSNVAWIAGYLLIALGALHATRRPSTRVSELQQRGQSGPLMVMLPYIPVAVVLGLSVAEAVLNDPIVVGAAEFFFGTTVIVLLLVRQGFVILENSRLASSLENTNEQLQYQLVHDALTGLSSRALFVDRLQSSLARLARHGGLVTVMFVDLDRFKAANDTYGHEAGDAVLVAVAERMSRVVRASDTVARFAGDEFLVLCEDLVDDTEAHAVAERIATAVGHPIQVGEARIVVEASIGVVIVRDPEADAEEILKRSDDAMYEAKQRTGSDHVVMAPVVPTPLPERVPVSPG
jgi:diguanylate cyclase (GGDEF)-like protein